MRYISCTFILFFFCVGLVAQKNITATKAYHNIYAVIVGISQYAEGDNIPALKFAHRDAQEFANFLQSSSGGSVPAENIRLLLNENATVAAVYNALTWLTETCATDDLVYFYFAGHGDKESQTIYDLGFLLTYNTIRPNYKNNALRIEDLNDYANQLSVKNNANVVLITDACHSGDITSSAFHWSSLVGEDLRKVKNKEIRIASCTTNQLSAEDKAWGGGRGAFSWYLVNGLKGLADKDGDGIVTVNDIQIYLDSCFARDPILAENNIKQNPVLTGKPDFDLANVDKTQLSNARALMAAPPRNVSSLRPLPTQPQDYFFNLFKQKDIENALDFFKLDKLSKDEIGFTVIDAMAYDSSSSGYRDTLAMLRSGLKEDPDRLKRFDEKLAETIHTRAETVIAAYLKGDEAELEKRRYYNAASNGYDAYPMMFSVAAKLTSPDNRLQRILQVDQHYFAGVVARLKIPLVEDPSALIATSMAEQQQALALDDDAANIQNEMGNLFLLKQDFANAEKYYLRATQIAPDWAIPWANLCGLYAAAKKNDEGLNAGRIADSLQEGLQTTSVNLGYVYEAAANKLFAEESDRRAIDINSRHYLPFERLGYLYTNTTQYEMADSFFYEASLRKKGFHFDGVGFPYESALGPILPLSAAFCNIDSNKLLKDDVMGLFYFGMTAYLDSNYASAERFFKRIIAVDQSNPLVYHYLGKIFYDHKKWESAEVMFNLATLNKMGDSTFVHYCDSVSKSKKWPYYHGCVEDFFSNHSYEYIEDHYFLASIYEQWGHYDEAETKYNFILSTDRTLANAYLKLLQIMEKLDRYTEAEKMVQDFATQQPDAGFKELVAFYKRAMNRYPADPGWPYRLGLLLYGRATDTPSANFLDTIVYFPLMNKEIFLGLEEHNNLSTNKMMLLDRKPGDNTEDARQVMLLEEAGWVLNFPGTKEKLTMAVQVYTPRKDAITYLSKAAEMIKEPTTLADINFKIGNVYVCAGSKKQAYPYYDMAVRMAPDNAALRLKIVDIAHDLYKNKAALENMQYLYDQKQINFTDRMLLAEFDIHAGKFDMAKKILDEAAAIYPYNVPAIHDLKGRLLMLAKKPAEALPLYQRYLSENNNDKGTSYTIAKLYAQMNDKLDAWKWLETAMKKGFNYSWVLKYDPDWQAYRSTPQWNSLIAKYPNTRTYVSAYKN